MRYEEENDELYLVTHRFSKTQIRHSNSLLFSGYDASEGVKMGLISCLRNGFSEFSFLIFSFPEFIL